MKEDQPEYKGRLGYFSIMGAKRRNGGYDFAKDTFAKDTIKISRSHIVEVYSRMYRNSL